MTKCPRPYCNGTIQDAGYGELKCHLCGRSYPPAQEVSQLPKIRNERSDVRQRKGVAR